MTEERKPKVVPREDYRGITLACPQTPYPWVTILWPDNPVLNMKGFLRDVAEEMIDWQLDHAGDPDRQPRLSYMRVKAPPSKDADLGPVRTSTFMLPPLTRPDPPPEPIVPKITVPEPEIVTEAKPKPVLTLVKRGKRHVELKRDAEGRLTF